MTDTDVSAGSKIFAGIIRAHRQQTEFTATDVLAFAPGGVGKSTVSDRLDDLESLDVIESRTNPDDKRSRLWSLVLDPEQAEIPAEERIIGGETESQ